MKRTKLVASLLTCVMCLSFLAVGVWAAVSVNFGLGASLQFTPEGIFVELSGQVYRGDSASTLEPLTSDPRFTLEKQTNFDNSSSEPSGNFPLQSWDIDNLTFTPVDRFIEIRVTIKNHSAFAITATPTAQLNNQDITSSTFTNFTVTDNREESEIIASGETKTYSLLIELKENSTAFTGNAISVNFTFDDLTSLLTWVADSSIYENGYWTLTMGEYEGTPLVWRMIGKEENGDVENILSYDQNAELKGSYYFILDTYNSLLDDKPFLSGEKYNYMQSPNERLDEYGSEVAASDYAASDIRKFIVGNEETDFIKLFNIDESLIYDAIEGRTLQDLYKKNYFAMYNTNSYQDFTDIEYNSVVNGKIPSTTSDKFWLISAYELFKMSGIESFPTQTTSIGSCIGASFSANFWTRSTYCSNIENDTDSNGRCTLCSGASGYLDNAPPDCNCTYATRPCFKISF